MIYVVATLTVKPETRAEFIAAAIACIKETMEGRTRKWFASYGLEADRLKAD